MKVAEPALHSPLVPCFSEISEVLHDEIALLRISIRHCIAMKRAWCIRECEVASCASRPKFLVSDSGVRAGENSFFLGVTPPPRIFDVTVARTGDLTPDLATTEPVDTVRAEDAARRGDDFTTTALAFSLAVSPRWDLDLL